MAERLEDGNKKYAGRMMITEDTYNEPGVKEAFLLRHVDYIPVHGKDGPTAVYNVWCRLNEASEEEKKLVELHNRGMQLYTDRKFEEAAKKFEEVIALNFVQDFVNIQYKGEDEAAKMLRDRCRKLAASPLPDDWKIEKEAPI